MQNSKTNSIMQWDPTFLDYMQPGNNLDLFSSDAGSSPLPEDFNFFMPDLSSATPPDGQGLRDTSLQKESVSVSTVFFPGSHKSPTDTVLRSCDSVLFYLSSETLLQASPHALSGFLSTPLSDLKHRDSIIDVPETSAVLNIIIHAMYGISCVKHSPSMDELENAVKRMPFHGLDPKDAISVTTPLFDLLLSRAPLHAIRVYTLAAQFDIYDLALKTSSHLLSYDLSELTDDVVTTMGAIYLRRLMALHINLVETLKKIILQPPPPHPTTPACDFMDQKKLSRAWALAASYLAWDSKPDLSISQLQNTLLALGDHLECVKCKEVLQKRVKEVVVQWVSVKRTI